MPEQDVPLWMHYDFQIRDDFETRSSELAEETAEKCLPLLTVSSLPELAFEKHIHYLKAMLGRLPSGYAGLDASRPWILYWTLMALSLLGYDVSTYRASYVQRGLRVCATDTFTS